MAGLSSGVTREIGSEQKFILHYSGRLQPTIIPPSTHLRAVRIACNVKHETIVRRQRRRQTTELALAARCLRTTVLFLAHLLDGQIGLRGNHL